MPAVGKLQTDTLQDSDNHGPDTFRQGHSGIGVLRLSTVPPLLTANQISALVTSGRMRGRC